MDTNECFFPKSKSKSKSKCRIANPKLHGPGKRGKELNQLIAVKFKVNTVQYGYFNLKYMTQLALLRSSDSIRTTGHHSVWTYGYSSTVHGCNLKYL